MDDFKAQVLFRATGRLLDRLEENRKNRVYRVWLYAMPTGIYDIAQYNDNHSLREPTAQAEYSCGCWCII